MANKVEILRELKPLLVAFDKHLSEEVAELWIEELKNFTQEEIRRAVRSFLDSSSQKTFPRIGEFKAATGADQKAAGGRKDKELTSCLRCNSGYCSVVRLVEGRPVHYAFRCSCPSGNRYPGFPLVSPHERTKKEEYATKAKERRAAWGAGAPGEDSTRAG